MAHERVDLVRERDPDDRLAVAGAGDRGGRVVRPGARRAISGESPTRPGCLPCVPPVEVAAATRPCASRATAPTVLPRCVDADGRGLGAEPVVGRCEARLAGEARRRARRRASRAGPRRARRGRPGSGCGCRVSAATAPAARSLAAHERGVVERSRPCSSSAAPRPALKTGSSSSTITAACTASSASPPAARTAWPASTARCTPARAPVAVLGPPGPRPAVHDHRDHAAHDTSRRAGRRAARRDDLPARRRHERREPGLRAPAPGPARRTTWSG